MSTVSEQTQAELVEVLVAGRVHVTFAVDGHSDEEPIGRWLAEQGVIDDPPLDLFLRLVHPGMRVLDIGCHLGTFSLPSAALGAHVLSVDASARNIELLGVAAAHNRFEHLRFAHAAITDRVGGTVPFLARGPHGTIIRDDQPAADPALGHQQVARVPATTVDDLLAGADWRGVDLIKMDIEGAEIEALRGMHRLFESGSRPPILFESNAAGLQYAGGSASELLRSFHELGYLLFFVDRDRDRCLVPVADGYVQPDCVADYLAAPSPPQVPEWRISEPFDVDEIVSRLLTTAANPHEQYRRYAAVVLASAPEHIRRDPEVSMALRTLADDESDDIRDAIAGRRGSTPLAASG